MSEADRIAEHFEAKKYAYRQSRDGMVLSFILHPDDVPNELATAKIGQRYMIACAQIGEDERPVVKAAVTKGERAMARANLICREKTFQEWVRLNLDKLAFASERESWIAENLTDEEIASNVIRSVCEIESRKELLTNEEAQEKLKSFLALFEDEVKA